MKPLDTRRMMRRARIRAFRTSSGRGATASFDEVRAVHDITILVDWLKVRGVTVGLAKSGQPSEYYFEDNEIVLAGDVIPRTMLYHLLHEVGHYVLSDVETSRRRWPKGYMSEVSDRTVGGKVDRIAEEFAAWEEGRRLADELGIIVDDVAWHRIKSGCLISHIRTAAR